MGRTPKLHPPGIVFCLAKTARAIAPISNMMHESAIISKGASQLQSSRQSISIVVRLMTFIRAPCGKNGQQHIRPKSENIFDAAYPVDHQSGRNNRDGRVFWPRDLHFNRRAYSRRE
jgi:hypothetical protein